METTVRHITSGRVQDAEIYTSFVYLVDDMRKITKQEFEDFFEIVINPLVNKFTFEALINGIWQDVGRISFYTTYAKFERRKRNVGKGLGFEYPKREKSPAAHKVLELMDDERLEYSQALKQVLESDTSLIKSELENELNYYI